MIRDEKPRDMRGRTIPILHDQMGNKDIQEAIGLTSRKLSQMFDSSKYLTYQAVENLSKHKFDKPVVSLYLTLTGENTLGEDKHYLTEFNSMMRVQLDQKESYINNLPHEVKESIREDLSEIQAFLVNLSEMLEGRMKSLIIFKSCDQLNFVLNLLRPIHRKNILVINQNPYTLPLLEILEEENRVLLVHLSKDETVFYSYLLGRIRELDKIDYPSGYQKVNVKTERTAGKGQAYYKTHLNYFYKDIIKQTKRYIKAGFETIVLVGEDSQVNKFYERLPKDLQKKYLGNIPISPGATIEEIRDEVNDLIDQNEAKFEEENLADIHEAIGQGRGAEGINHVINAQNRFMTKAIYFDPAFKSEGFRCPDHDYLSIYKGACEFCEKGLIPVRNIVDELLEVANKYGVETFIISHHKDSLKEYGGVAAILYQEAEIARR